MRNIQPSTLSKEKYTFQILDAFETVIEINENPYQIPAEELFIMAARKNKKRSFLFVSKVLGKHWPIEPNKGLLTGALLAARFLELRNGITWFEKERLLKIFLERGKYKQIPFISIDTNPIVIGFAETATALGQAFFDCFQSADYFHTTREEIESLNPVITFEEEHSHATSHRLYIPREMLESGREIILVDDELTTGKTALNIIRSIQARFPRSQYTVISILDWRSKEHVESFTTFERELGININVVSLIAGTFHVRELQEIEERVLAHNIGGTSILPIETIQLSSFFSSSAMFSANQLNKSPFIKETGRFGLNSSENERLNQAITDASSLLKGKRIGTKALCLGTGELMYLPMKIAAQMGENVFYQSTTRSPIFIENREGYGARFGLTFNNPEDPAISHYVYNIPPGYYDELFLFLEREVNIDQFDSVFKELEKLQFQSVKLVFFSR